MRISLGLLSLALACVLGLQPARASEPERADQPVPGIGPALSMPTSPPPSAAAPPVPAEQKTSSADAPKAEPAGIAAPADAASAGAPPAPVQSPVAAEIAKRLASIPASVSGADRAALVTFYAARGNAPVWSGKAGLTAGGSALVQEMRRADDWGLRAADFDLPPAAGLATEGQLADAELKLMLAALKYARHARGGRMDPTMLSNAIDRKPPLLEPKRVLDEIAVATAPDAYLRGLHPQHPQFERLRQKYIALRSGAVPAPVETVPVAAAEPKGKGKKTAPAVAAPPASGSTARRVLLNMEQWRWMPESLGDTYVWVNIPEFTLRVVKGGRVIHSERVITGLVDKQTPTFSENMATIVFHPFWGVPDSIKVREILPGLVRGNSGVLAKNGLRMQNGGRDIDPGSVDWSSTDIRNFHVYQPPGGSNVLGVVKFLFPNKHQVYMHDTPTKGLFNATQRTFSHGCMRVRNPMQLAEVLLAVDKGWTKEQVTKLAAPGAPQNNSVNLTSKIPVHVTYFTASVDDEGKLELRPDVYGHEEKIQMGLDGRAHLIVKKKDDLKAEVISRLAEARARPSEQNWLKAIFGF